MITTEVDKVTSVLDHRLLGHTDNVKITTAKGIDILRDILNDMLQHGKRDNMHIRAKGSLQRIFEGERVGFVQFLIALQIGVEFYPAATELLTIKISWII